MTKIFISSIIKGFEKERKSAKAAIQSLSMQPIMAEDFSAKPYSPKTACSEGVSNSDVYLGILGQSYGFITNSGISVTEEEFNKAREIGIPILWFIMDCERDSEQDEFVKRIKDYEEGYFISSFNSTTDLVTEITKALHECILNRKVGFVSTTYAANIINKHIKALTPHEQTDSYIAAIIVPEIQNDTYVSAIDLGKKETIEKFQQPALFGPSAILARELGTKEFVRPEGLSFVQKNQNDVVSNTIEFYPNGILTWRSIIPSESDYGPFTIYMYVIEEKKVRNKLLQFFRYADLYYSRLINAHLVSSFYFSSILYNLESKKLGNIEPRFRNGFSMGFSSMQDPLVIPQEPMKLTRSQLKETPTLADNITELIVRAFKSKDLYYSER